MQKIPYKEEENESFYERERKMTKSYETVWEIFNECANNQMRDVFIDEIDLDEDRIEEFLRGKIRDRNATFECVSKENGTTIYEINASGIRQRYSFTEI